MDDFNSVHKGRVLLNIFCCQAKGFNVCSLNARSIRGKIDEFRLMFEGSGIHAIVVSESWLQAHIPSSFVSLQGYKLFRNDRSERLGGGVVIYIKDDFRAKIISFSRLQGCEFVLLEVDTGIERCVLGAVYCPPRVFNLDTIKEFEEAISRCTQKYQNVIIGGDFNVDVLRHDLRSSSFVSLLQSLHLGIINSLPTYVNSACPSQLDLVLVSDIERVYFHNQLSPPSFLDHDILFVSYGLPLHPCQPKIMSYRNYNNVNLMNLGEECSSLVWNDLYSSASVDSKVEILTSHIKYLHDQHVPLIRRNPRSNSSPWFSTEISSLIAEREFYYRINRRVKSESTRALYISARNRVTTAIKRAKRQYFQKFLNPDLPSKQLWKNLKRLGICNGEGNGPQCNYGPDELNAIFTSRESNAVSVDAFEQSTNVFEFSFSFRCVEADELVRAIRSIKSDTVGPDDIHPRFLKMILPFILPQLLHVFNYSLTSSSFPRIWKVANVLAVPKISSPKDANDFRPISLLSFLAKVLERLLSSQVTEYLETHKLLCSWQSGFRSQHSCETALLKVTHDLRLALDRGHIGTLVLLDFSKAFDSVSHNILLLKLSSLFGFSSSAIRMMQSFLCDRWQRVKSENNFSELLPLVCGVPQGSILGPLLFSIFINDLPGVVEDVEIHMYADDVQVYSSSPIDGLGESIERTNRDLSRIYNWSVRNHLRLNPQKSKYLLIQNNSNVDQCSLPNVWLNGSSLSRVECAKNLGVIIGSSMKCCDHVNHTLGKIYGGLRRLWLTGSILSRNLRLKLVKSLLLPHFTFGSLVFPKLDSSCSRRLNVAFNDCVRYVYGLRRFDHVSHLIPQVLGHSLDNHLKIKLLVFMYNLIHNKEPKYLYEHLVFLSSSRHRNLLIPRFRRTVLERSFFVQAARAWNDLPVNIQNTGSLDRFKMLLMTYFSAA